jgi:hypothetical protein
VGFAEGDGFGGRHVCCVSGSGSCDVMVVVLCSILTVVNEVSRNQKLQEMFIWACQAHWAMTLPVLCTRPGCFSACLLANDLRA